MQAPLSIASRTPAPPAPNPDRETLGVIWIGEPQGIEKKLPAIAPDVRVSAHSADSALEVLRAGSSDTDIVVIDTTTPGVDAQTVLQRMKAAGIDLPVVLIAASGTGRMVADANQLAVCDVVVRIQGFEQQLPAAFAEVRARHDLVALFRESRQGQDRLRAILEFQPAVVGVISSDGTLAALNQAGLSLLGSTQEKVVGRTFADFLPSDERNDLLDLVRRACSGETGSLDHSVLSAGAVRVDVRTRAVPFKNTQGGVALVTIEKRSGAAASEMAALTERCVELTSALEQANASLEQVRAERTSESARVEALTSELAESAGALALERDKARNQLVEAGTSHGEALGSLSQRCDALTGALAEATAQLDELRTQRARESQRADVLSSELAESAAAFKQEREQSQHLVAEMRTTHAETLSSLTERCDALTAALGDATAQLDEVRAERARESARAETMSAELTESAATLNIERERSQQLLATMAASATELASLKEQGDAAATALRESHAQLDEVRSEHARELARSAALASDLAASVAVLTLEREKSSGLLTELASAQSMLEQSSKLQPLFESNHESMTALREQLRRFAADADLLCSAMIERNEGIRAGSGKVLT